MSAGSTGPNPLAPAAASQFGEFCAFNKTKFRDQTAARTAETLHQLRQIYYAIRLVPLPCPSLPGFPRVIPLMSYAPDTIDQYPHATVYFDRIILKGEKPADLPWTIQRFTRTHRREPKALGSNYHEYSQA
jgi:hypothetical protein